MILRSRGGETLRAFPVWPQLASNWREIATRLLLEKRAAISFQKNRGPPKLDPAFFGRPGFLLVVPTSGSAKGGMEDTLDDAKAKFKIEYEKCQGAD